MFRYERPQKGRYRQFHQIGAEAFGMPGHMSTQSYFATRALMAGDRHRTCDLELNTLGTSPPVGRIAPNWLNIFKPMLRCSMATRSVDSMASRILDSKNPAMQDMINPLIDMIDSECRQHFDVLCQILNVLASLTNNTRLVRGLDYYSRTVFEWTTDKLGAQGTVCGGGRYDGLTEHSARRPHPGAEIQWASNDSSN